MRTLHHRCTLLAGLFVCERCKCVEGNLPTDCPGEVVDEQYQDFIAFGKLNFRAGEWKAEDARKI